MHYRYENKKPGGCIEVASLANRNELFITLVDEPVSYTIEPQELGFSDHVKNLQITVNPQCEIESIKIGKYDFIVLKNLVIGPSSE